MDHNNGIAHRFLKDRTQKRKEPVPGHGLFVESFVAIAG